MTRLTTLLLTLAFWSLWCCGAAHAVELESFTSVLVLDGKGNQIFDCTPSQLVVYEAVFTLGAPGFSLVSGKVTGDGWSETLGTKLRIGFMGTYNVRWKSKIPFTALGTAKVDITVYAPFLRQRLVRTAFFTITPTAAAYVGSESCKPCHTANYDAWFQTEHATAIGCEACHGPGSAHIATGSPDKIILDTSSSVCAQCHLRNNGTVIEAEDGFIISQQQYNEYISTKHGKFFQCATCHNPHYSISQAPKQAIKLSCRTCHPLKTIGLGMQFVACESCHMPSAIKTDTSTGIGPYRKGDTPSHIWRIKSEVQPQLMFSGATAIKDSLGPFLTLNFSCMGCHNGLDAKLYDFTSVQQTATLVH